MVRFLEDLTAITCILTCLAFLHLSDLNLLSPITLGFKLLFYILSFSLTSNKVCVYVWEVAPFKPQWHTQK